MPDPDRSAGRARVRSAGANAVSGRDRQQVDATAPQSARARSGEQETDAAFLDESMDFIEKDRQALDPIEHHDRVLWPNLLGEASGPVTERQIHRRIQQVVDAACGNACRTQVVLPV